MINPNNVEIRDQAHLMDAEGTSDEPVDLWEVEAYLRDRGFKALTLESWFDAAQGFYRWSTSIEKIKD